MEGLSTNSRRISLDRYDNSKGLTKKKYVEKMSIMFNQIYIYIPRQELTMNEMLIFFKIVTLEFNTLITMSILLVEVVIY